MGNECHDKFFLFISFLCLPKRSRNVIRFSFDCFIRQIQELGGNARQLIFIINIDINIIWFVWHIRHGIIGRMGTNFPCVHQLQTDVPFDNWVLYHGLDNENLRQKFGYELARVPNSFPETNIVRHRFLLYHPTSDVHFTFYTILNKNNRIGIDFQIDVV